VVPGFHCSFLPDMPSSPTSGSSIIATVQYLDADTVFAVTQPARRSQVSRNPIRAGGLFLASPVRNCYGLSGCFPPLDGSDWDTSPATGDFYFQASDGLVALPAAGYHYDIDWTPMSAGLAPAGRAVT
jgi:hypothetical protein